MNGRGLFCGLTVILFAAFVGALTLITANTARADTIPVTCAALAVGIYPHAGGVFGLDQEAVDPAGVNVTSTAAGAILPAAAGNPDRYKMDVTIKNVQNQTYLDVWLIIEFALPNDKILADYVPPIAPLAGETYVNGLHDIGHDGHAYCGGGASHDMPAYSFGDIPPNGSVTKTITLTRDASDLAGDGPGPVGSTTASLILGGCADADGNGIPDQLQAANGIRAKSNGIVSNEPGACSRIQGNSNASVVLRLPPVGGAAELLVGDSGAVRDASSADSGGAFPYAALAGGLAAVLLAIAAGGWYARRRFVRQ